MFDQESYTTFRLSESAHGSGAGIFLCSERMSNSSLLTLKVDSANKA